MLRKLATLTGTVVAAASLFVAAAGALPNTTTKVITPNDLDNTSSNPVTVATDGKNKWFMYNDTNDTVDNSLGSFVYGPATPPAGKGSVQFTLGDSASKLDRMNIATFQYGGKSLASLTKLSYSAYSHGGVSSSTESPYLLFNVDFYNTGAYQNRLVYVPSANQASVPQDQWNTFDAVNGGNALYTWSGLASHGNQWPDGNPNQYRKLSDIEAAFVNIKMSATYPFLGVRVGEPGPTNYTANVDKFVFGTSAGTTVYDFEPTNQPTNDDQCRNNGWKNFNAPVFASQKACNDWVNASAHGNLKMSGPSQQIKFNVANVAGDNNDRDNHDNDKNKSKGTVEYWNYDYPGGLHYKAQVLCANVNPATNDARFMYQIPTGHGGLSGQYVVVYVKDNGKNTASVYGHNATGDLATAQQWCESGTGFSPINYPVTKGHVHVN